MRRLRENLHRKIREFSCNHIWLLHHDNAPANTSLKTTKTN
jgi:hypothetical protein